MSVKFTKQQVEKMVRGSVHAGQTKKVMKETGLAYKRTVKDWELKKALKEAGAEGYLKKIPRYTPGAIVRRGKKEIIAARRDAAAEGPERKPMTPAELRKQMEEEKAKKEKMAKMMSEIYKRERQKEEEKATGGKQKASSSAFSSQRASTSALERKSGLGRPEVTTSALRKPEAPKKEEEKPKVVELPI